MIRHHLRRSLELSASRSAVNLPFRYVAAIIDEAPTVCGRDTVRRDRLQPLSDEVQYRFAPERSGDQFSLKTIDEVMVCTTGLKLMLAKVTAPVSGRVLFS